MNRVLVAIACLAALGACRTNEPSFQTVTFENADRDRVFDVCQQVVATHFFGTTIRADKVAGRIDTDPIEEVIGGKTMREQCYVQVSALADGTIEVAVFARLLRLEIAHGTETPVRWVDAGEDLQVEAILIDEISGRVLALEIDARVLSTSLPREARPR